MGYGGNATTPQVDGRASAVVLRVEPLRQAVEPPALEGLRHATAKSFGHQDDLHFGSVGRKRDEMNLMGR